jgi:hypothetical protein
MVTHAISDTTNVASKEFRGETEMSTKEAGDTVYPLFMNLSCLQIIDNTITRFTQRGKASCIFIKMKLNGM